MGLPMSSSCKYTRIPLHNLISRDVPERYCACVFRGMMDDVQIWNRALSADEVQSLFNHQ